VPLEKMAFSLGANCVALLPQKLGRPLIKKLTTRLIKGGFLKTETILTFIPESIIKRISPQC
jgi:hypothetical protein